MFYLHGPNVGRRHDITLYRQSGLDEFLSQHLSIDGEHYCINADNAFMPGPWVIVVIVGYDTKLASAPEHAFNTAINAVRTAFEWSYKDFKQQFTVNNFSRILSVRKMPTEMLHKA